MPESLSDIYLSEKERIIEIAQLHTKTHSFFTSLSKLPTLLHNPDFLIIFEASVLICAKIKLAQRESAHIVDQSLLATLSPESSIPFPDYFILTAENLEETAHFNNISAKSTINIETDSQKTFPTRMIHKSKMAPFIITFRQIQLGKENLINGIQIGLKIPSNQEEITIKVFDAYIDLASEIAAEYIFHMIHNCHSICLYNKKSHTKIAITASVLHYKNEQEWTLNNPSSDVIQLQLQHYAHAPCLYQFVTLKLSTPLTLQAEEEYEIHWLFKNTTHLFKNKYQSYEEIIKLNCHAVSSISLKKIDPQTYDREKEVYSLSTLNKSNELGNDIITLASMHINTTASRKTFLLPKKGMTTYFKPAHQHCYTLLHTLCDKTLLRVTPPLPENGIISGTAYSYVALATEQTIKKITYQGDSELRFALIHHARNRQDKNSLKNLWLNTFTLLKGEKFTHSKDMMIHLICSLLSHQQAYQEKITNQIVDYQLSTYANRETLCKVDAPSAIYEARFWLKDKDSIYQNYIFFNLLHRFLMRYQPIDCLFQLTLYDSENSMVHIYAE